MASIQMTIREATNHGTVEDLKTALQAGGDVNAKDRSGLFPLHWAVSKKDPEKIRLLLAAGADPNAEGAYRNAPLCVAVSSGRVDLIEILRQHGAKADCNCDCGSLVAVAVLERRLELLPLLHSMGVDVNKINSDGFAPLMLAAGNDVADAIPILIALGADIEAVDTNHGLTAYLHAAVAGDKAAGHLLADAGANLNAIDNTGMTAKQLALENGHVWPEGL